MKLWDRIEPNIESVLHILWDLRRRRPYITSQSNLGFPDPTPNIILFGYGSPTLIPNTMYFEYQIFHLNWSYVHLPFTPTSNSAT